MQQLKCTSCGVLNNPGQTVCGGCGTALVATPVETSPVVTTPVMAAPVVASPYLAHEPASTVVVEDRGMSDAAKILTGLFAIIGVVIVGVLFYQFGQANRSESELERARLEQARAGSASRTGATPTSQAAPAPIIVTTPAASPTVVTSSAPSDAPSSSANEGLASYKASMDPILRRWRDAVLAAEAASGANLETAITALREVERSASMVSPPSAAARVHGRLSTAMQALISEFKESARKQTAVSNSTTYVESQKQFDAVVAEIDALNSL